MLCGLLSCLRGREDRQPAAQQCEAHATGPSDEGGAFTAICGLEVLSQDVMHQRYSESSNAAFLLVEHQVTEFVGHETAIRSTNVTGPAAIKCKYTNLAAAAAFSVSDAVGRSLCDKVFQSLARDEAGLVRDLREQLQRVTSGAPTFRLTLSAAKYLLNASNNSNSSASPPNRRWRQAVAEPVLFAATPALLVTLQLDPADATAAALEAIALPLPVWVGAAASAPNEVNLAKAGSLRSVHRVITAPGTVMASAAAAIVGGRIPLPAIPAASALLSTGGGSPRWPGSPTFFDMKARNGEVTVAGGLQATLGDPSALIRVEAALSGIPAMITVLSTDGKQVLMQNAGSTAYYGSQAAGWLGTGGGGGRGDCRSVGATDTHTAAGTVGDLPCNLLEEVFCMEHAKLERMLSEVCIEGRVWKGIIQVPSSCRPALPSPYVSGRPAEHTATGNGCGGDATLAGSSRAGGGSMFSAAGGSLALSGAGWRRRPSLSATAHSLGTCGPVLMRGSLQDAGSAAGVLRDGSDGQLTTLNSVSAADGADGEPAQGFMSGLDPLATSTWGLMTHTSDNLDAVAVQDTAAWASNAGSFSNQQVRQNCLNSGGNVGFVAARIGRMLTTVDRTSPASPAATARRTAQQHLQGLSAAQTSELSSAVALAAPCAGSGGGWIGPYSASAHRRKSAVDLSSATAMAFLKGIDEQQTPDDGGCDGGGEGRGSHAAASLGPAACGSQSAPKRMRRLPPRRGASSTDLGAFQVAPSGGSFSRMLTFASSLKTAPNTPTASVQPAAWAGGQWPSSPSRATRIMDTAAMSKSEVAVAFVTGKQTAQQPALVTHGPAQVGATASRFLRAGYSGGCISGFQPAFAITAPSDVAVPAAAAGAAAAAVHEGSASQYTASVDLESQPQPHSHYTAGSVLALHGSSSPLRSVCNARRQGSVGNGGGGDTSFVFGNDGLRDFSRQHSQSSTASPGLRSWRGLATTRAAGGGASVGGGLVGGGSRLGLMLSTCWHEVSASRIVDPVTGQHAIVLTQTDVTAKVEAERHIACVTEAEHRILEQIFPRHILAYMTEEEGPWSSMGPSASPRSNPNSWRPAVRDINKLATHHSEVTLLFADIQGFTPMCKVLEAQVVMAFLNDLFTRFDNRLDEFGVYKVETIGDCYFAAGGLIQEDEQGMAAVRARESHADPHHADKVFRFAQAMLAAASQVALPTTGGPVRMRVGIHSGPVVSGVVGQRMPRFCLFGDTVNTTSRMESSGVAGCIHASETAHQLLKGERWTPTGGIDVKGKGIMKTFLWVPPGTELPAEAEALLARKPKGVSPGAGPTAAAGYGGATRGQHSTQPPSAPASLDDTSTSATGLAGMCTFVISGSGAAARQPGAVSGSAEGLALVLLAHRKSEARGSVTFNAMPRMFGTVGGSDQA